VTMSKLCICILLACVSYFADADKNCHNYKVIQITPRTKNHLETILSLNEQANGRFRDIDFWREPSIVNASIDIMVSPEDATALSRFLAQRSIPSKIVVDNVHTLIDQQLSHIYRSLKKPFKAGDDPKEFAIDQYHSIAEIYDFASSLASARPDLVSISSIGSSFEKRDMKLIKIGAKGTNKPAYFLDAGIHAREWISVSTAVYIINELATKYDSNPTYKELLDKIDFYILPSVNPDGYEYTRSKDRMWRKTRSGPYSGGCYGVDPNRNFDFHWKESGASSNPCDEDFAGPNAFSEIECSNLANFLKSHNDTVKAYLTLHSYSDLFMHSFGYKAKTYPPDVNDLKALANEGVAAIKATHGTTFKVGSPPDVIYAASGASDDWTKGVANIKWVYTLELRPGDGDTTHDKFYGFVLPASYIIPVAEETWAGLQVVAKKIISG